MNLDRRRKTERPRGWVLAASFWLAGCGSTPFALTQSTLEDHRARWLATGIRDYAYVHSKTCECLPATTLPARVEVRAGQVRDVTYTGSGAPADPEIRPLFPTIDELFDRIDEAIARDAATLIVTYDGALGYPTKITIDYDPQEVDDEITIDATGLTAL